MANQLEYEAAAPVAVKPKTKPTPIKVELPKSVKGVTLWLVGESYALRYRDPKLGGKQVERRLKVGERAAKAAAVFQSDANEEARMRREAERLKRSQAGRGFEEPKPEPVRYSIAAEVRGYYAELASAPNASQDTLGNVEEAAFMFLVWCDTHGFEHLDQLNRANLETYRTGLLAMRKANGQPYKISTINQWLKYPKRILRLAAAGERAPHLNSDVLGAALRHTKIARKKDRKKWGVKLPRALTPAELKAFLRNTVASDAQRRKQGAAKRGERPACGDLAMVLLGAFRRRELTFLKCGDLKRVGKAWEIDVRAEIAKGLEQRDVWWKGVSPIGQAIALELARGRAVGEWFSMLDYEQLGHACDQLEPKASLHVLRATCVTYQLGLKKMHTKHGNERAGHSMSIADADYYDPPRDMATGKLTLEAVMRAEKEFAAVLAELKRWPRSPRTEDRPSPARRKTQALLSKDAQTLNDALARFKRRLETRQK